MFLWLENFAAAPPIWIMIERIDWEVHAALFGNDTVCVFTRKSKWHYLLSLWDGHGDLILRLFLDYNSKWIYTRYGQSTDSQLHFEYFFGSEFSLEFKLFSYSLCSIGNLSSLKVINPLIKTTLIRTMMAQRPIARWFSIMMRLKVSMEISKESKSTILRRARLISRNLRLGIIKITS